MANPPKNPPNELRYGRAYQRALYVLRNRHRDDFAEILEVEKAREGIRKLVDRVAPK